MSEQPKRNEEFKRLAKLWWDNKTRLQVEPSNDKKSIKIWLDDVAYNPEGVFNGLFDVAAKLASKDEKGKDVAPEKAIAIFHQLRAELHSFMVAINLIAKENNIEQQDDYSDVFTMIESFANWSVIELDSQLKANQIITNNNTLTTNTVNKKLLGATTLFALLAVIVGAGSWYVANKDLQRELNKDKEQQQLEPLQKQIQSNSLEIGRMKNEKAIYLKERDSLKKIVDSLLHKYP